jgi:hypothetical protein
MVSVNILLLYIKKAIYALDKPEQIPIIRGGTREIKNK